MANVFRLLTFSSFDKSKQNEENENSSDSENGKYKQLNKEYLIQMYGLNDKGESASILVTGYTPFFYVKVDESWNNNNRIEFIASLKNDIGIHKNSIFSSKIVKKKKLYEIEEEKKKKKNIIKIEKNL